MENTVYIVATTHRKHNLKKTRNNYDIFTRNCYHCVRFLSSLLFAK